MSISLHFCSWKFYHVNVSTQIVDSFCLNILIVHFFSVDIYAQTSIENGAVLKIYDSATPTNLKLTFKSDDTFQGRLRSFISSSNEIYIEFDATGTPTGTQDFKCVIQLRASKCRRFA